MSYRTDTHRPTETSATTEEVASLTDVAIACASVAPLGDGMKVRPIHQFGPAVGKYKQAIATNIRRTFRAARKRLAAEKHNAS